MTRGAVLLLLAVCLTGAVAQTTQSPLSCYIDALFDFGRNNTNCAAKFIPVVDEASQPYIAI